MFIITLPDLMRIINIKCITRDVMGLNNLVTKFRSKRIIFYILCKLLIK